MVQGEETVKLGDIGGRGRYGSNTNRLRPSSYGGHLLQVPGSGPVGFRLKLSSGDLELSESAAEIGISVAVSWSGGFGCTDVSNVIHHSGSGGYPLWVGVVVHISAYW